MITTGEGVGARSTDGSSKEALTNLTANMREGEIWGAARIMQIGVVAVQSTGSKGIELDRTQARMRHHLRSDVETKNVQDEEVILARALLRGGDPEVQALMVIQSAHGCRRPLHVARLHLSRMAIQMLPKIVPHVWPR